MQTKASANNQQYPIRVLYAEDSPIDADLTVSHFSYEAPEFAIDIAGTGEEFLRRLKEGSYDVLLLDYRLPDMDGIELLKELTVLGVKLPIVMVTGTGDEELVVKILRFGTSDYVPKDVNYLNTLPATLKNAVIDYRTRLEEGKPPATLPYHILYVEHSPYDLDLTVRHFAETAPHIALEGMHSAELALNRLRGVHDFDLVLMDLRMPDIPGLEFMHRIKQLGINLPVIIITGKGDEDTAVATLKLSAYDYIVKRDNYLTQLPYAIENAIARFQLNNTNEKLHRELTELNKSLEEKVVLRTAELQREVHERRRIEEELSQTLESLRNTMSSVVQITASVVEARDPYTAGHQKRVANLAGAIATEMGLSAEIIEGVRVAGTIHDVGKISVPAEILSKPGKLNAIEFSLIKVHPQTGYDLLKNIELPWPIAEMVYQHHEKINGTGYPRGLRNGEICIEAKILAVADVMEAISSHRPYRPALGIEAALEEIEKNAGILYDGTVAGVCLKLFREKGFGFEERIS
jgi:putative two-component system response regulator